MMDTSPVKEVLTKDAFHNNNEVQWLKFPYKISDVDEKINAELLNDFTGKTAFVVTIDEVSRVFMKVAWGSGERTGFVQVGPKKWFFPSGYRANAEIYYNFQPRMTDVWVVSFPRSGTTWTQELVWLLANNLDYEKASETLLDVRFPFLEFSSFVHPKVKEEFLEENKHSEERCSLIERITASNWKLLMANSERRFIKTHLPFELLPPDLLKIGCKVIYVARNPKDVAVSFFHLNRLFRTQGYVRDFEKYWYYFKNGLQPWTPYWSHVLEAWERRHEPNFFFTFYEDMVQDLKKCVMKLADFLEVKYTNEEYEKLIAHLNIENFRNNKSVNGELLKDLGIIKSDEEGFVRKGKSGEWREYFTEELNKMADEWNEENLKKNATFPNLI